MADGRDVHPFVGYRPFGEADAAWFFGRERDIDALDARLATARIVAVVGPAEHGTSSLVRAGLIPRVRQRGGRVAVFRPGEDPIGNLAQALSAPEALDLPVGELSRMLRSGPAGLVDCVRAAHLSAGQDLLVVVDQFDELFRYRHCREGLLTAADDSPFVALLASCDQEQSGVRVLFTIRANTVGECQVYPALYEAAQHQPFEVQALTEEQLRRAIEEPIAKAGGRVSAGFVDTVVQTFDSSRARSALPLIQHVLMRAWEAGKDSDGALSVQHLDAVGGVSHALVTHADQVCAADPRPELVDKVVKCITTHVDGHFAPSPAPVGKIAKACEAGVEDIADVVARLQARGINFLKPPATGTLSETSVVDVSYDSFALVRQHRWSYQAMTTSASKREWPERGGRGLAGGTTAQKFVQFARELSVLRWLRRLALVFATLVILILISSPTDITGPQVPPCVPGQMLVSLGDGAFGCTPDPPCAQGQILVSGGGVGALRCEEPPPSPVPQCPAGQILVGLGGNQEPDFECVTQPPCPTGLIAYGPTNGPVRCLTLVIIERLVCGDGKKLTGTGSGPFSCVPDSSPIINLHIDCLAVAGPAGGPVSCVTLPPPTPREAFPCNVGEMQIGLGGGTSACVTPPPCRQGQIAYGQADGPFLCMTPVIIERIVCGERSRLVGPDGDEFRCQPGAPPNVSTRIDLRIECLTLVGPTGGPLKCGPPPPSTPSPSPTPGFNTCGNGEIRIDDGRGGFRCGNLPVIPAPLDARCPDGEMLVGLGLRQDGKADCKPIPQRPSPTPGPNCRNGEIRIDDGRGGFRCGSLPVIPAPLDARCPDGEMLVGLGLKKDGKADCKPLPPGPSLQFADLSRVEPGFVYPLQEKVWRSIKELDLSLRYCTVDCPPDPGGLPRQRVLEARNAAGSLSLYPPDADNRWAPVPDPGRSGQFDVRFTHGGYHFLITLGPDRQAVIRRCAGAPCAK